MPYASSDLRRLVPALALCLALGAHASGPKRGTSGAKAKSDAGRQMEAAVAPKTASTVARLDSTKIHTLYLEGEFEEAIAILEGNLRNPLQYNLDDSVFIYKHLGVMYAASEATREKGRYYMHRLLMVEPTAKIMDMYASDMIYMIFKNIQEEFHSSKNRSARPAPDRPAGRTDSAPPPRAAAAEKQPGRSGYVWMGAAALAVAAGAATWIYMAEEQPKVVVMDHQPE